MYQKYWGLQRSIFDSATAREALAQSPVHIEALARLEFLLESHSTCGLLFGPAGSGKTTVLTQFAEQVCRSGALPAFINCAGNDDFILTRVATGLHAEAIGSPADLWRSIVDRLEELKLEGLRAVLLFDDLERASSVIQSCVEQLLAIPDAPLTVVASARTDHATRIGARISECANLRIDLTPWTESETSQYLKESVAKAGRAQPAFDERAVRRLFELSGGAPRKVNQLAQLALVAGAGQRLLQVDAATIDAVEEELSLAR
jgi:type II secretory pathway predicted ATPase ExeA